MKRLWVLLVLGAVALNVSAACRAEPLEYRQDDTVLEGWVTYDDTLSGQRPGVLIIHQWKGLTGMALS